MGTTRGLGISVGVGKAVSFSLALEDLTEVSARLQQLVLEFETERSRLLHERDELLRDAIAVGMPMRRLQAASGLSRTRLNSIRLHGTSERPTGARGYRE